MEKNEVEELSFEDDDGTKIGRYEISSYNLDKPIETLIKWKENGKLVVPDFQRDFVWKFNVACRLIDSVLLNLPIPGIFVCRRIIEGEEKYYLIDGLQRITTLEQFKNKQFISKELNIKREFKITLKNSDWYQKTFDTLSYIDKENFLDYSIGLTVFEISEKNEAKNLNAMFEIFERINTGSEKLSSQEIRNAIYPGDFLELLKKGISSFDKLVESDEKAHKRKKDQELILRLTAYYYVYKQFSNNEQCMIKGGPAISSSKIETLNNFLYYSNQHKIDYEIYYDKVIKALNILANFNPSAFYTLKRDGKEIGNTVHEVFSEAIVIAVIENNYDINIPPKKLDSWKIENWNTDTFKPFIESTTNKGSIMSRVKCLRELLMNGNN